MKKAWVNPPLSSLDSDYGPGLGQIMAEHEDAFQGTRSRVVIPFNYNQPFFLDKWCFIIKIIEASFSVV